MTKRELAESYFRQGYNCAQSVFLAFAEELGLPVEQAALLSGGMGGGIGRMREMCGALSGAILAMGALNGYPGPSAPEEKGRLYAEIQDLIRAFEAKNGSHTCRDLLIAAGLESAAVTYPTPEQRTPEYYAKRPCGRLVGDGAELLEQYLKERNIV